MSLHDLKNDIQKVADPARGKLLQRFFKTGKGEYGEGDVFLGLTVPQSRLIAKQYRDLHLIECQKLLSSRFHEERLIALFILCLQFTKGGETRKKEIYELYLSHTRYINNWDLVDSSAHKIVGEYVWECSHPEGRGAKREDLSEPSKDKKISHKVRDDSIWVLERFAKSENLWERRIAIIATFAFINNNKSEETLHIAEILLHDPHDLIHKAVGWALREVGKRVSLEDEEAFLKTHYKTMPRTMLRYAIERFPEERRKKYLQGSM